MDLRRCSFWNWAVAVVLALQLALAFGHTHETSAAYSPKASAEEHDCLPASAAVLQHGALVSEGAGSCVEASGLQNALATGVADHVGLTDNFGHGPDDDDKDCELCGILAALSALIVPLLLALLPLEGPSRRVRFVHPVAGFGALTTGAYLARAPPLPIHA